MIITDNAHKRLIGPSREEMPRQLVLGCGTGRCGTQSLAKMLRSKFGIYTTHELSKLPWYAEDRGIAYDLILELNRRAGKHDAVGDVAFYWIRYLPYILEKIPDAKCICLIRDIELVVNSWMVKRPRPNWFTHPASKHWDEGTRPLHGFDFCFPRFDAPKEEAIRRYYQQYYRTADCIAARNPESILIINTHEALNTEQGLEKISKFINRAAKQPSKGEEKWQTKDTLSSKNQMTKKEQQAVADMQ